MAVRLTKYDPKKGTAPGGSHVMRSLAAASDSAVFNEGFWSDGVSVARLVLLVDGRDSEEEDVSCVEEDEEERLPKMCIDIRKDHLKTPIETPTILSKGKFNRRVFPSC